MNNESPSTTAPAAPGTPASAPAVAEPTKENAVNKTTEPRWPIPGSKADRAAKAAEKLKNGAKPAPKKKDAAKKKPAAKKPAAKKAGAKKATARANATYPACSKKNPYREKSMKAKAYDVFAKGGTRATIIAAIVKLGASEATASTWVQRFRGYAAPGGEK